MPPLAKKASGVVAGSAKKAVKGTSTINNAERQGVARSRTETSSIVRNRDLRREQGIVNKTALAQSMKPGIPNKPGKSIDAGVKKTVRRFKASVATITVIAACAFFYAIQFAAALFYVTTINWSEEHWFLALFTPDSTMNAIAFAIVAVLGVVNMIQTLFIFFVSTTKLNKTWIILTFPLCLAGSIFPYSAFVPWVLVWSGVIIYNQE